MVANGKTQAKVVDLGQTVGTARCRLPARAVALTLDGLRAYVVASGSTAGQLTAISLVTAPSWLAARCRRARAESPWLRRVAGVRHLRRPAGKGDCDRSRLGAPLAEIATAKRPAAIALSPEGTRAYVIVGPRKLALVDLVGAAHGEDHPGRPQPVLARRRPAGSRVLSPAPATAAWQS